MDDQDGPSLWLKNAPRLNLTQGTRGVRERIMADSVHVTLFEHGSSRTRNKPPVAPGNASSNHTKSPWHLAIILSRAPSFTLLGTHVAE